MSDNLNDTARLISELAAAVSASQTAPQEEPAAVSTRERFQELMVLALANLYGKTPVAATLYDRTLLKRVTDGMDDGDAGRLSLRAEDWLRLEGLVKAQEGQKAYYLSRGSLAALSEMTPEGTFGEVLEQIQSIYASANPTPAIRGVTRKFGAYFLRQVGAAA